MEAWSSADTRHIPWIGDIIASIGDSWYGDNATREYPIIDGSVLDVRGQRLPPDLLADLLLVVPDSLSGIGLSGLTMGPRLITLVFGNETTAVAAVTIQNPIVSEQVYTLTPLIEDVGGWIVFGSGVDHLVAGRFEFRPPARLSDRSLRYHPAPPVQSLSKVGSTIKLKGLVRLSGRNDVEVVGGIRQIEGVDRTVGIVRLSSSQSVQAGRNLFDVYKGPCGGRPEANSCLRPALEQIGEAVPDCAGNIDLLFASPFTTTTAPAQIVVNIPIGLSQACEPKPFDTSEPPGGYSDHCPSQFFPDDQQRSLSVSGSGEEGCSGEED